GERRVRGGIMGEGTERHQRAARRPHIDMLQAIGVLQEGRPHFQHHMVLIQRLVHRGDLALAKGIVECILDRCLACSQAGGGGREAGAGGGARFMASDGSRPGFCRVVVASVNRGSARMVPRARGGHSFRSRTLAPWKVNWYCGPLTGAPKRRTWKACMKTR